MKSAVCHLDNLRLIIIHQLKGQYTEDTSKARY